MHKLDIFKHLVEEKLSRRIWLSEALDRTAELDKILKVSRKCLTDLHFIAS